jgi:hypothetical protein
MSRYEQLESTFELPRLEDCVVKEPDQLMDQAANLQTDYKQMDHFTMHDNEMDSIADLATEYGKSLHDLGMNVEVKHAGEIFNASSNMLKIALDARNSKMEKKLKMLKLELDRLRLDRTNPDQGITQSQEHVTILDRNQLLDQIKTLAAQAK